jgi:hypothetical protein
MGIIALNRAARPRELGRDSNDYVGDLAGIQVEPHGIDVDETDDL